LYGQNGHTERQNGMWTYTPTSSGTDTEPAGIGPGEKANLPQEPASKR
jgi:hypothetical protein